MRIEIDFSAANDPDAHQWLDRILYRIEDGWHVWDTSGQPDPGAIEASTWVRDGGRQGGRVRELLVASTQRGAWTFAPHGRRMRVTARPRALDELTPEDAFRHADVPLVILVENRISDGAFVTRVVTELDKSLHRLWQRRSEPIQLDSVGGVGQMLAEVERRTQGRRYLAQLTLHAPRQWGACWLALTLWERLELDRFWRPRLPASRIRVRITAGSTKKQGLEVGHNL